MGLSEHEQRVLAELERGLYADDEPLARRMSEGARQTLQRKQQSVAARRIAGSLVALAGLGVILTGAILHLTFMGVAGFALTLVGLVIATSSSLGSGKTSGGSGSAKVAAGGKKAAKSLGEFFEERWDRRMNG